MSESLTQPTLPTFSWIGHLKDDDRDLLSSYGEFFPGHPGTVIIQQGVIQTEVFVVISGELAVHAERTDGSRILRARVGPGETLGEISLFDPGPATATVTASEFSQLWRIADEDLIQFMEDNPGAGNLLLRTLAAILAQRLRRTDPEGFRIERLRRRRFAWSGKRAAAAGGGADSAGFLPRADQAGRFSRPEARRGYQPRGGVGGEGKQEDPAFRRPRRAGARAALSIGLGRGFILRHPINFR